MMNESSVRRFGRLSAGLLVAALAISLTPSAQAADDSFVLNQATTGGPGIEGTGGNYDQTFRAVEIRVVKDWQGGKYSLDASEHGIPLSWEYYPGDTVTGTGGFYMHGAYDPTSGAVTGTFTFENAATGTIKGSFGDLALDFSETWKGDVTGTIKDTVAELYFSGNVAEVCTMGGEDCSFTGTQGQRVWFTVAKARANATVPEDTGELIAAVSGAVGEVYLSPASEADLETSQRTWQLVKPGDRIVLSDGVMLRTGRDGTLKVQLPDTSWMRLQPSTLFEVKKLVWKETSQLEMYTRMFQGIADFYMRQWAENHKKFEVEVDRAIVGIKGTTWEMSVTDAATVVTVSEGVVALTDKATGETIDVNPGEQATVDATGMTKKAVPDASAQPDASGSPATVAPVDSGWRSGGSGPPIGILVAIIAGIVAVALVVMGPLRRRSRT